MVGFKTLSVVGFRKSFKFSLILIFFFFFSILLPASRRLIESESLCDLSCPSNSRSEADVDSPRGTPPGTPPPPYGPDVPTATNHDITETSSHNQVEI